MTKPSTGIPRVEGRTHIPKLNWDKCVTCFLCQYMCPDLAITRDEERALPIEIDYTICRGCGICDFICPQDAIEMLVEE